MKRGRKPKSENTPKNTVDNIIPSLYVMFIKHKMKLLSSRSMYSDKKNALIAATRCWHSISDSIKQRLLEALKSNPKLSQSELYDLYVSFKSTK